MSKKVVIIGNGISGITAARHIRKRSDYQITVIGSETKHFFSRTALMYIYMGHMKYEHTKPYEDWFWKKNKIELIHDHVTSVDTGNKELAFAGNTSPISYDYLIIATGSKSNKFGWPGQDLDGVQGLYSMQDLELMEANTKSIQRAVVVGGGLIGVEMAEMLHSRHIPVTFLVREEHFWGNVLPRHGGELVSKHIRKHGIDLRLETELKSIESDGSGRVQSVIDSNGDRIECQFVGLTAGVHPNTELAANAGLEVEKGILVDEFLQTSFDNIYALGDCVQHRNPQPGRTAIEQVWYTGRKMGETVAQTITGERTAYEPGPWFNSAKLFDIEYQTYGIVRNVIAPGESEFYWEDSKGEKGVHFVWDSSTEKFLGINTFGIRMRHENFDNWLRSGATIHEVIRDLPDANFDPEFFPRYESEIKSQFEKYLATTKP